MKDRFVKDMNLTCRDTLKNHLYAYASELVSLLNDYDKRLANQITISNYYCRENKRLKKELEDSKINERPCAFGASRDRRRRGADRSAPYLHRVSFGNASAAAGHGNGRADRRHAVCRHHFRRYRYL